MASFFRGEAELHFDVEGDGYPVLLIAPGGMRSANDAWEPMPWNPRTALAATHRVIGMDQRNAGRSTAPVSGSDGWHTYLADQIALLDHLEIERCHVIGMCIGGPYVLALLRAAPERFSAAVLLQPVGVEANTDSMYAMFDRWAAEIGGDHPEASEADWVSFRSNMWDGEFVITVSPDDVAAMTTPMLVMMGNDHFHPPSISRRIAALAPNATLVEEWKEGDALVAADTMIKQFLDL